MRGRRGLWSALLVLLFALPAGARDNGDRLLAHLVSLTDPESLELCLDDPPDEKGRVRHLSCVLTGGTFTGFRVEKVALEAFFLELSPPSAWGKGGRRFLDVRGALCTRMEVVLLEKDLREALTPYPCENYRLLPDLLPGKVSLRVRFTPHPLPFPSVAEVVARPALRGGRELWLEEPRITLNGQDRTDAFREEFLRVQPFADLGDFGFPAGLTDLSVDGEKLALSTRTLPGRAEGRVYRYERSPAPAPRRPEIGAVFRERLRDGDLLFVNGKAWRTKLVRLAEKSPPGASHVGVVRVLDGVPRVVHASPELGRMAIQSLEEFFAFEGVDFARVCRLADNPGAAEEASRRMEAYARRGVPFDDRYDAAEGDRLYCTEAIWRAFGAAGVDLAGDRWISLRNPIIRGRVLLPYALSRSPLLVEVSAFP